MNSLSTLPTLREQARHALLLLGVPAPARLVVDVHAVFFDSDLSVPALAALMREDERSLREPTADLAPAADRAPAAERMPASDRTPTADRAPAAERMPASDRTPTADRAPAAPGGEAQPVLICPALHLNLSPARGLVTLSTWPLSDRLSTPALARAHALVATMRIAEFAAARAGASGCARELLERLAADVPGGPEALDLAEVARGALDDPALAAAMTSEEPQRGAALARAETLDKQRSLFGVPSLPHQRGGA